MGRCATLAANLLVGFAALVSASTVSAETIDFAARARQAYLMDADSGAVLFQVAGEERMYPASMSKLMTLAVMFRALKDGTLKPTDELVVSEGAWRRGGGPSNT